MEYVVVATLGFVCGLVAGLFLRGSLYIATLTAAAKRNLHLGKSDSTHETSSSTYSDESKK
jgi:hypothetical protein